MPIGSDGLRVDQAVGVLARDDSVVLVAETEDRLVGMAIGTVAGPLATVHRVSVLPEGPADDVVEALLERLEGAIAEAGGRRITLAVGRDEPVRRVVEQRGYRVEEDVVRHVRELPETARVARSALSEMGARMVAPGLWDELKGLEEPKHLIERRVILPLAEPDMADRHAVAPPRAIVLFGPPGTGKTTFAKGIASRLQWPFLEVQPAELAGEGGERQARALAEIFTDILELPAAVVFVDEVEDLASARDDQRRVAASVTNEFLRQIVRVREGAAHLLVCATNWVDRLDPAFLRPGRFDYVLPVGPPDAEARRAIWERYVGEITDQDVDLDALVEASELHTPADIEFAARKAAQRAFEREHFERDARRATTEDFLAAIRATRPTLSSEVVERFEREDIPRFARS